MAQKPDETPDPSHRRDRRSSSHGDWQKQTISIPIGALLVIVSTLLGTLGGTGVMTGFVTTDPDTKAQLVTMEKDLKALNGKLDEIYRIVDRAHPRFGRPPSTSDP